MNNDLQGTKYLLVDRLEKLLPSLNRLDSKREDIQVIIDKARQGYYHDFETPIAMPKVQLYRDLEKIGLTEIANEVKEGLYDE